MIWFGLMLRGIEDAANTVRRVSPRCQRFTDYLGIADFDPVFLMYDVQLENVRFGLWQDSSDYRPQIPLMGAELA